MAYCGLPLSGIRYKIISAGDSVSAFIHLPRMFLFTDFRYKQRIRYVTLDLLHINLYQIYLLLNNN